MAGKIDNNTLRSLVVNCRDRGMTYQEISNMLRSEYGVVRTRQAVQQMYVRATNVPKVSDIGDDVVDKIIKLSSFGYSTDEIVESIGRNTVSKSMLMEIISRNRAHIQTRSNAIMARVVDMVKSDMHYSAMKAAISYGSYTIKDAKLKEFIECAAFTSIMNTFNNVSERLVGITGDKTSAARLQLKVEAAMSKYK